jgi:hypothetical protein
LDDERSEATPSYRPGGRLDDLWLALDVSPGSCDAGDDATALGATRSSAAGRNDLEVNMLVLDLDDDPRGTGVC